MPIEQARDRLTHANERRLVAELLDAPAALTAPREAGRPGARAAPGGARRPRARTPRRGGGGAGTRALPRVTELAAVLRPGGALSLRGGVVANPAAEPPGTSARSRPCSGAPPTARLPARRGPGPVRAGGRPRDRPGRALPPGGTAPVELQRTAQELGLGTVPDRLAGVYPLRLELRDDDGPVDVVTTSVVALPEVVGEPVRFALVAPLDSAIALPEDDAYSARTRWRAGWPATPRGCLAIARELAAAPEIPSRWPPAAPSWPRRPQAGGYVTADAAGPVTVALPTRRRRRPTSWSPTSPPCCAGPRRARRPALRLRRPRRAGPRRAAGGRAGGGRRGRAQRRGPHRGPPWPPASCSRPTASTRRRWTCWCPAPTRSS